MILLNRLVDFMPIKKKNLSPYLAVCVFFLRVMVSETLPGITQVDKPTMDKTWLKFFTDLIERSELRLQLCDNS